MTAPAPVPTRRQLHAEACERLTYYRRLFAGFDEALDGWRLKSCFWIAVESLRQRRLTLHVLPPEDDWQSSSLSHQHMFPKGFFLWWHFAPLDFSLHFESSIPYPCGPIRAPFWERRDEAYGPMWAISGGRVNRSPNATPNGPGIFNLFSYLRSGKAESKPR